MSNLQDLFAKIERTSSARGPVRWIVAGLGNPGAEYRLTRHNAGFLAVDYIAQKHGCRLADAKFRAMCGECEIGGQRAILMQPQTFMNNSGEAVGAAATFYKIPPEQVVILYDDLNFEAGHMRIRASGSDGGHNGMKSIIYHLNSDHFPRIRIGIGNKPRPDYDLAAWVLGKIPEADQKAMFPVFEAADDALNDIVAGRIDLAMSRHNH